MTNITITASVQVSTDEVYASLNRKATQAKVRGDWTQAVHLLRQAKAHRGNSYDDTRLAKFLQQAGQLDEALTEIAWLVERSQWQAQEAYGHLRASSIQLARVMQLLEIYEAAILISKRARRADLQLQHQIRRDQYEAIRMRLEPLAQADEDEQQARRDANRLHGRNDD
ncbi:MAG: hypothetical protein JSR28_14130 [Proteobacteria bacterium]|nr:hypothetical protein [Pseudomonadota bacterium]